MFEGFVASYEQRELSFDETYYDLCKALSDKPLRGPRELRIRPLIDPIQDILGGTVILEGGRFYVRRNGAGGGTVEAHLLAEGHRKLASIAYLILTGALMEHSVLFWDEPEANLNPKLTQAVVEVLRALVREGVQVFVATHDYLITQELALQDEYNTDDKIPQTFFSFTRDRHGYVKVDEACQLAELPVNPILSEFVALYEREQTLAAGALG